LGSGLNVEQCSANIELDAGAQITEFGLTLFQRSIGLLLVGTDLATVKDRKVNSAGDSNSAVRIPRCFSDIAIISIEVNSRNALCCRCPLRQFCSLNLGFGA